MTRPLATLLAMLVIWATTPPWVRADDSAIRLPSMGESAAKVLSPADERRLGEAFMRQLRQQVKIVEDPEVNAYLQSVGYRLVAAADPQPFPFTFFIVADPTINAFAAPGGFIGVHTGLILAAQNEDELAAVLAHEISHVTQHHMARMYEAASRLSLPTAAALLAAVLLGAHSGQAGEAALAAITAGSAQYQINFTRSDEEEADNIGMQVLHRAGYDPHGMPEFFGRMLAQSRLNGDQVPAFLQDHPVTTARIADSEARADRYGKGGTVDRLAFHLAKARLEVLDASDPQTILRRVRERTQSGDGKYRPALEYEYAFALQHAGDPGRALPVFEKLLATDPDRITYRIGLAQDQFDAGDTGAALDTFRKALQLYPGNRTISLYYAQALLQSGHGTEARDLLEDVTRDDPGDPEGFRLLARAAAAAGARWEGHAAMAEFYFLNGQTTAAIEQIKLALKEPGLDFYETSRLEARLQDFKDASRREAKK